LSHICEFIGIIEVPEVDISFEYCLGQSRTNVLQE